MNVEAVAKICHDTNRSYCQTIGDNSQMPWEDAPQWQRESAVNGVNFHLSNPLAGARGSHENWMREKISAGWKFGKIKDADKKTHPCIVPYDQLPFDQGRKDALFVAIVHVMKNSIKPSD